MSVRLTTNVRSTESVRLTSSFGQCPNRPCNFLTGASLTTLLQCGSSCPRVIAFISQRRFKEDASSKESGTEDQDEGFGDSKDLGRSLCGGNSSILGAFHREAIQATNTGTYKFSFLFHSILDLGAPLLFGQFPNKLHFAFLRSPILRRVSGR